MYEKSSMEKKMQSSKPNFSMTKLCGDSFGISHLKAPRLNCHHPSLLWQGNCIPLCSGYCKAFPQFQKMHYRNLTIQISPYIFLSQFAQLDIAWYYSNLFSLYPCLTGLADVLTYSFNHNKNIFKQTDFTWSISSSSWDDYTYRLEERES